MASQCLSKDDTWQTILADELMEKSTITPRTLSILKDDHEYCDPVVLMNLRHDKSANRSPKRTRESLSKIMEAARRNLKTEISENASGAMHKKIIDNEVEKFKQHLAKLKRINANSNRSILVRKPLKVRFQRVAICSRSCGPSVTKPRKRRDSEFESLNEDINNPPEPSDTFFDLPLTSKLQWSSSIDSLDSDMSLPAVYGNSVCGTTDILQKGPNTTPISFCSGILPRRLTEENCSQDGDFFPEEFCENESLPSSPEPPAEPLCQKLNMDQIPPQHHCTDCAQKGDAIVQNENGEDKRQNRTTCSCKFTVKVESQEGFSKSTNKTENERKKKVKNTAYKQFMSYVCNKTIRATQIQNGTSTKQPPQVHEDEKASQREEKIALVLGYLQRAKISPNTSQSVTPPEPVLKAKPIISQSMPTLDSKTVRANGGPYENRYQAQRDLIKRQKMQLEEQQKKIQELTLVKLQEEAKNSQKDFHKTIDELGDDCTLSIRPQLKTLKATGNQPDFSSAGKIVERMEKRAKERDEKRQILAERRKLLEEERKRMIMEEEEKRKKEEDNKKREAFEKIREENIRQREIRERTRKEQERMLELNRRAEMYNKRRLCKNGLRAFKHLLVRRKELFEKAEEYYTTKVMKTAFSTWKEWVDAKVANKLAQADCFYKQILMRNIFKSWKMELTDAIRKRQVADDMYEMRLQERVFRKWSQYVNEQHLEMVEKLAMADQYYTWTLLKKVYYRWRAYPKIAHLEREKEKRKMVLRQKVQDMLPDFRPVSPDY